MTNFNKAVVGALICLIVIILIAGFSFCWNWVTLANFGQFVGGTASAVALALVAYGIVIQQKGYALSIDDLKQQTEILKTSTEAQLFNLLYSTLVQRSSDFTFEDDGTGPTPTRYQGVAALEAMANNYLRHTSLANLRPLGDRRSSIEAFVRAYLQTLKFIRGIGIVDKRRFLAELVINQFTSPIQKIVEVENSANKIGVNTTVLTHLRQVSTELLRELT